MGELLPGSCYGCWPMADQSQVTPSAGKWAFASNKPACLEDPFCANVVAGSTSPISPGVQTWQNRLLGCRADLAAGKLDPQHDKGPLGSLARGQA